MPLYVERIATLPQILNSENPLTAAKQTSESVSNNIHTSASMKNLDTACSPIAYEYTDGLTACREVAPALFDFG